MLLKPVERMVAGRYLRARREEGMISVIALFSLAGIALGVMTLIVVLSVMNGVRSEMIKSIIGLDGHVTVYSNLSGGITDFDAMTKRIADMPEVAGAAPKIEGQIMASYQSRASGAMVAGYRNADLDKKTMLLDHITQGSVDTFKEGGGVIIGQRLAEKLGLDIGDDITLISPEGQATIAGLVPRVKAYPVVAMFSVGMFAYDSSLILMPFEEAQIYFKVPNAASLIEINLKDADSSTTTAYRIAAGLSSDYRVYDWKRSNAQVFNAAMVQRNVMFLILLLIILVACFNIISSLIMLVREKGRDVAILRTMGMGRASVQKIFILCGMSVGIMGTAVGVIFGLLIACNTENIQHFIEQTTGQRLFADELYFLSKLPARVEMSEVLFVVAVSLLLSFLATLYPSWRAAKMNPAEALRYE